MATLVGTTDPLTGDSISEDIDLNQGGAGVCAPTVAAIDLGSWLPPPLVIDGQGQMHANVTTSGPPNYFEVVDIGYDFDSFPVAKVDSYGLRFNLINFPPIRWYNASGVTDFNNPDSWKSLGPPGTGSWSATLTGSAQAFEQEGVGRPGDSVGGVAFGIFDIRNSEMVGTQMVGTLVRGDSQTINISTGIQPGTGADRTLLPVYTFTTATCDLLFNLTLIVTHYV